MFILIAGAGTVGYMLAKVLSYRHNVVIIDKNLEKLNKIAEDLDVLTIHGDIEDPQSYKELDITKAHLYIAVTDSDEANLLSTLVVEDEIAIDSKIVRLKNDSFATSGVLKKLDINYAVFPNLITANKIEALLNFPKANNVKHFSQTHFELISIKVDYPHKHHYLIKDILEENVVAVGVERKKLFTITDNEFLLEQGDLLYLFGDSKKIAKIADTLNQTLPNKIKRVVIFGANELSQKIAKRLLSNNIELKIIEKDKSLCKEALEYLNGQATIINASYNDHSFFKKEGVNSADMIIATFNNDEKNIVKCIEAKEYGVAKVVALNNDKEYYELMHMLGVIVVRGTKAAAYYSILENISSSLIVTQRHYCGGKAILFMRKIYANSPFIGKSTSKLKVAHAKVLLIRNNTISPLEKSTFLEEGDIIVLFGLSKYKEELEKWIYEL